MSSIESLESSRVAHAANQAAFRVVMTPSAQSLRLLAVLRTIGAPFQALLLWYATDVLALEFASTTVGVMVALQALAALLTWMRLSNQGIPVTEREVLIQVHVDIVLLAASLYLSGGTFNPFAPMLLLPMVAAASLQQGQMLFTAMSTVVAYVFLRHFHVPMTHPMGPAEVFRIHASGDQFSYFATTATLAYLVHRALSSIRRHERMLAEAQERQMRSDSVVAIGAFAAGCAHELSSPLATMSVVVKELRREAPDAKRLNEDLAILDSQIRISKEIVTQFTGAAGRRRAESASAVSVDRFLTAIVERARLLHPGASIQFDAPSARAAPRIVAEETLRQALTNLIDNAVHACPREVYVKAEWCHADLVVTVTDRGPGFTAEALQKLGTEIYATGRGHGPRPDAQHRHDKPPRRQPEPEEQPDWRCDGASEAAAEPDHHLEVTT
jgi:two-component system sensor histidine kinase RegB